MAPDAAPLILAELRALGNRAARGSRHQLEMTAATAGRLLIEANGRWVLGWEQPIDPRALRIHVRELSPLPLVVLAVCIGLCWPDRSGPLYPGVPTSIEDIVREMVKMGATERGHRYLILAAIEYELSASGLITKLPDGRIALGPAIAAWQGADFEGLRRAGDLLPGGFDG